MKHCGVSILFAKMEIATERNRLQNCEYYGLEREYEKIFCEHKCEK